MEWSPGWTPYEDVLHAEEDRWLSQESCGMVPEGAPLPSVRDLRGRYPFIVTDDGLVVDPLTGEVQQAETDALLMATRKAKAGRFYASALAERVVGGALSLGTSDDGEVVLYGPDGEELYAAKGEAKELRAAALLLLEAATPWAAVGHELGDDGKPKKGGRIFGIGGSGYAPGLRHSPGHQRKCAFRSRKEARKMVRLLQKRLGHVSYDASKEAGGNILPVAFTVTTPTIDPCLLPGVMVTEECEERRMFMAWALLRKRSLWTKHMFGGFRGYEITRKVFGDGWITFHPHFHLLMFAKFIEQAALAAEWWDCLKIATLAVYGFDIDTIYDDTSRSEKGTTALDRATTASIYVQAVRPKAKRGQVRDELGHTAGPLSLEDAIQETLKYCTKADKIATYERDIENPERLVATGLPTDYLRQEILRRSCRVFECVGAARGKWEPPEWCQVAAGVSPELLEELRGEAAKAASLCSLDTPPIADGSSDGTSAKPRVTLRTLMDELPLHEWLQIASRRAFASLEHLKKGLEKKGYWVLDLCFESPG